jgi:hypothetical protein
LIIEVISRAERVIEAHHERETAAEAVRPPPVLEDDFALPYGKRN